MSLFLTEDELIELTGFKRRKLQLAALGELGYEFRVRPADGFPLVNRSAIEGPPRSKKREPDWLALKEAS